MSRTGVLNGRVFCSLRRIGVISAFGFLYRLACAVNRYYGTKAESGENSYRASDRFLNEFFATMQLTLSLDTEVHRLRLRVSELETLTESMSEYLGQSDPRELAIRGKDPE